MTALSGGLENAGVLVGVTMSRMARVVGRTRIMGAGKLLEEMVNSMRRGVNEKEKKKNGGGYTLEATWP